MADIRFERLQSKSSQEDALFQNHFISLPAEGSLVLLISGLWGSLGWRPYGSTVRARLLWVRPPRSESRTTYARLHKVEQFFKLPFASVFSTCEMGIINLPPKVTVQNSVCYNRLKTMLSITAIGSLINFDFIGIVVAPFSKQRTEVTTTLELPGPQPPVLLLIPLNSTLKSKIDFWCVGPTCVWFYFPLVHFRNKEVSIPCQLACHFRLARLLSVSSIKIKALCS